LFTIYNKHWYCIPIYVSSFFGLDAPETLHHVIAAGVEVHRIVKDIINRKGFDRWRNTIRT